MSGNVDSIISESGLVENVGVEVEIASLSQVVQNVIAASVLTTAILDFWWKETSDCFGESTIEKLDLENKGGGQPLEFHLTLIWKSRYAWG